MAMRQTSTISPYLTVFEKSVNEFGEIIKYGVRFHSFVSLPVAPASRDCVSYIDRLTAADELTAICPFALESHECRTAERRRHPIRYHRRPLLPKNDSNFCHASKSLHRSMTSFEISSLDHVIIARQTSFRSRCISSIAD